MTNLILGSLGMGLLLMGLIGRMGFQEQFDADSAFLVGFILWVFWTAGLVAGKYLIS